MRTRWVQHSSAIILVGLPHIRHLYLVLEACDLAVEASNYCFDGSAGFEWCTISVIINLIRGNHSGGLELLEALSASASVTKCTQVVTTLHNESFLAYSLPELGRVADPQVAALTELILSLFTQKYISVDWVLTYVSSCRLVTQGRLVKSFIILILAFELAVSRVVPL